MTKKLMKLGNFSCIYLSISFVFIILRIVTEINDIRLSVHLKLFINNKISFITYPAFCLLIDLLPSYPLHLILCLLLLCLLLGLLHYLTVSVSKYKALMFEPIQPEFLWLRKKPSSFFHPSHLCPQKL